MRNWSVDRDVELMVERRRFSPRGTIGLRSNRSIASRSTSLPP